MSDRVVTPDIVPPAAGYPGTPPPDATTIVVVLRAVRDPLARTNGGRERDADYRLKMLLRDALRVHGFRCRELVTIGPAVGLADAARET